MNKNKQFEPGTYYASNHQSRVEQSALDTKRPSWLRRNAKRLGAVAGLGLAGLGLAAGTKQIEQNHDALNARRQAAIEHVVSPQLATMGEKVLSAYNRDTPDANVIQMPGKRANEVEIAVSVPVDGGSERLKAVMGTKPDGTPDASRTIFVSGESDRNIDSKATATYDGFELASADGIGYAESPGRPDTGWFAEDHAIDPTTLTGERHTADPALYAYDVSGHSKGPGGTAQEAVDTANELVPQILDDLHSYNKRPS